MQFNNSILWEQELLEKKQHKINFDQQRESSYNTPRDTMYRMPLCIPIALKTR
jgi:hypothetical protein